MRNVTMTPVQNLISVVVPCYNASRHLCETLESVAQQRGVDMELIVVDDGSTDDTFAVLEGSRALLTIPFQVVRTENRGASAARNTGTALARGEYIQYVDADDVLLPGTLAERMSVLRGGGDVAYCGWQELIEHEGGEFQPGARVDRALQSVHPLTDIAVFLGFWAPPAALLYRRSIVDAIGGWNEALPIIQDARFMLDAALRGAVFQRVLGIGALYRIERRQSLSRRDDVAFVLDCLTNAQQIERYWREHNLLDTERRQALSKIYGYTAYGLLGKHEEGFRRGLQGRRRNRSLSDCSKVELFDLAVCCLGYARTARVLEAIRQRRRLARAGRERVVG